MLEFMKNLIRTDGNDNVLELRLSVLVFQDGNSFVSYCPSLELSSYGESIQDAKDAFNEVMAAYIEDCTRNRTLPADLVKQGWRLIDIDKKLPKAEPPEQLELNIPAGVLKQQFNENWKVAMC